MKKSWLHNIKIKSKLFLAFGILGSMVVMLAIMTAIAISSIEQNYVKLFEGAQQRLIYASDAVGELMNTRRNLLSMVYYSYEAEDIEESYAGCRKSIGLFLEYLSSYGENLGNDQFLPQGERIARQEALALIETLFNDEYIQYVELVHQASIAKDNALISTLVHEGIPLGDQITEMINNLRLRVQEHANDIMNKTLLYAQALKRLVVTLAFLIALAAILVSILMQRTIKTPILNMEYAMREIAGGNLAYPIRNGYNDELGILANHIGDMVDRISTLNKSVNIMDSIEEIIFVTDLKHNLIYYNQKSYEYFCHTEGELINTKCYQTVFGNNKPCAECPLARLMANKENLPTEKWERYDKQNKKWLACTNSIIRWIDGSFVHICACKDDTPRKLREEELIRHENELKKAAEAAKEASRLKSAFLANMSHEIRTPMNGIIGFAELALDDGVAPKTEGYLKNIKISSEGLLQLINDILDISKIEAGKITLESIPFDLHDVFKVCQTITEPKAAAKGISLFCYAEPLIGRMLLGDPMRLRQVVLNLLSNAVKFTNIGIVKLLSEVEESDEDNVSIRFEIKDSGIGMTSEQISRIFEPFNQADDSTTRKYGGTGLGLSISKSIVGLMGGQLHVESTPGVGSKFGFCLKFPTIERSIDHEHEKYETNVLTKPLFSGTILVCEDNILNQQVISENLLRVGLNYEIVSNGRLCIEFMQRRAEEKIPIDLIFMDIHMPVMDGLEAAKKLIEMGCKTPIVALTANIMPNDKEMYKTSGMPDCLAKPFTAQQLWSVLLKYLNPVTETAIDAKADADSDEKVRIKLLKNFLTDNANTFKEINAAVKAGDIKLAHRQAHTLKSVAGLIGKQKLREAASVIEQALMRDVTELDSKDMAELEIELDIVINELREKFGDRKTEKTNEYICDNQTAIMLLNKLDPLLKACDTDCMEMIESIGGIPGAEDLIKHMEFFDYTAARKTLAEIKSGLEKDINV